MKQSCNLSVHEMQKFADPRYGHDKRLLELSDIAPTFLHSYGSALTKCPCTCRQTSFSEASLLQKGLRGCFVISRLHGQPRYLHPMELFALHGVPLTVSHVPDLRAAVCLIGQLASPLQALWVFSCLRSLAHGHDANQRKQVAMADLIRVQRQLVKDHYYMWKQPDSIPRHISVLLPDGDTISILSAGLTTVAKLLRAETFNLARGEMMHLSDGTRILPDDQILLEHGAHGPYSIQVTQTIDLDDPFAWRMNFTLPWYVQVLFFFKHSFNVAWKTLLTTKMRTANSSALTTVSGEIFGFLLIPEP